MPSDFITDLIDHKERAAKYMRVAADELFAREAYGTLETIWMTKDHSLIDFVHLLSRYHKQNTPIDIPYLQTGQMANLTANTLEFVQHVPHVHLIGFVVSDLFHRAAVHDNSKFSPEEFELWQEAFPTLNKYAYDRPEFKAELARIEPAVQHHYRVNDHHPQFFSNGVADMHGNQQIEMCCDWIAASERSQRDIMEGLEINRVRFGIDEHLFPVIKNTVIVLKEGGS